VNIAFMAAYPVWSTIMITIDVVIYACASTDASSACNGRERRLRDVPSAVMRPPQRSPREAPGGRVRSDPQARAKSPTARPKARPEPR